MNWILIYVLAGTFGGVTGHVEFINKQGCESAADEIKESGVAGKTFAICVKK